MTDFEKREIIIKILIVLVFILEAPLCAFMVKHSSFIFSFYLPFDRDWIVAENGINRLDGFLPVKHPA
jgi:hypothetical protein